MYQLVGVDLSLRTATSWCDPDSTRTSLRSKCCLGTAWQYSQSSVGRDDQRVLQKDLAFQQHPPVGGVGVFFFDGFGWLLVVFGWLLMIVGGLLVSKSLQTAPQPGTGKEKEDILADLKQLKSFC